MSWAQGARGDADREGRPWGAEVSVANQIAGSGQHSHEVPSELGVVVKIRDGQHEGTEVYRTEGGFRFVELDCGGSVSSEERCLLVLGADIEALDALDIPYGCDLDSPRGLALVGCETGESLDWVAGIGGEVLWDSETAIAETGAA